MQNKFFGSKLNTILLLILIILLGVTIYFLNFNIETIGARKELTVQNQLEESNIIEKEDNLTAVEERSQFDEKVEKKSSTKSTSSPASFLKSFLVKSLNVSIDECIYNGTTYFGVSYSDVADVGTNFYTLNAKTPTASCGGYMPTGSEDQICRSITNSCKTVYRTYYKDSYSGVVTQEIDIYNLK